VLYIFFILLLSHLVDLTHMTFVFEASFALKVCYYFV